ncbi:MAG: hypothetical protein HOI95_04755 [Chromatiales bacterium]|jgi:hypothetical protein|nr:hypothetical protein [Chromatiales bacterium]
MTFIQRFGSALNLNVHLPLLVLDGAYTFTDDTAQFHRAPAPSMAELEHLLDTLMRRIMRILVRAGVPHRAARPFAMSSRNSASYSLTPFLQHRLHRGLLDWSRFRMFKNCIV